MTSTNTDPLLAGGGEMGDLIRAKDWTKTPLRAVDDWPQNLHIVLSIMLRTKFPMFLFWGPEGICLYNDAYRPSLGENGKHPAILGMPAREAWPEIWPVIGPLIDEVMGGGDATWSENQLIPIYRNGRIEDVYWTFSYSPVLDEQGGISGVLVIATEVTDQVLDRKKIEAAEERARLAIEASRLGIWDYNPLTEELRFDEATMSLFEHDPAAPVNLDAFWTKMHPDDREPALQKMLRALDPAIPDTYYAEYRLQLRNDVTRWIQATGQAFFDPEKGPVRFSGTVQDITARKKADEVLRLTTEQFRLLADSMPQFVWTSDVHGNLNYYNQAVYDYSGLTPEEVATGGWLQIVHPDDREANVQGWMHAIRTGEDFLFEHRFRRHDDVYRWQLSRAIPQRDDQGQIQMWVGTSTDIHDHKRFAQQLESQVLDRTRELEQSNENLRKSNRELAEFSYVASHDLQEPLRKIQTFADRILQKEYESLSENGREYFQRMRRTADRMQTLIDDLLAYSRTNTTELVFERRNLAEIVEEVKDDLKERIQEKHAVIESTGLGELNVIPFQFHQMMTNLLGNALKFAQADVPPHIRIEGEIKTGRALAVENLAPHAPYCHIAVIDNGIGFEPEFSQRIFVLFQKLHGRQEYQGTGIGLAIVKKIVENHQGIITATGVLGEGARFDVYIPV